MAYTIFATFEYNTPEDRDNVLPAFRAHRDRCLANEPGTLKFDIALPNDDDRKVMLYEVYVDEAAFDVHWNGESVKMFRAEVEPLGIKSTLSAIRCTSVE
jgi:quinol monooxygenase YgiN